MGSSSGSGPTAQVAGAVRVHRPAAHGVLGISMEPGDLTGDGIVDLLTNEHTGGSGACGRWRVIASEPGVATEIFRRDTCDTDIAIAAGDFGSARPSTSRAIRTAA